MAAFVAEHVSLHPDAEIADDVHIGPFCVIGPKARIGRGTRLESGVTLIGRVRIGCDNHIYPGVVIGGAPQDLSFEGGDTRVEIGDHNVFRESVTINRGSEKEDGVTRLGDHNFLMTCSHVAHDCRVGNHVVITNGSMLGGHVHVHDHATLSGNVGVHHYCRIGQYAFIAGISAVRHDVPPYMLAEGLPARPRCINVVAMKRHGFTPDEIQALSDAHRLLYRSKVGVENAREILRSKGQLLPRVHHLLTFVSEQQEGVHGRGREQRRAA